MESNTIEQIDNRIKAYSRRQDKKLKEYKTSGERLAFLDGCMFANMESNK